MVLGVGCHHTSFLRIRKAPLLVRTIQRRPQSYSFDGFRKSLICRGVRKESRPTSNRGINGEHRSIKTWAPLLQRPRAGPQESLSEGERHEADVQNEKGREKSRDKKNTPVLTTSFERHLQSMAVLTYAFPCIVGTAFCPILFICALTTKLAPIAVGYAAWMLYDVNVKKTPSRGGSASDWMRRSRVWIYCRNYFPMSLVKTAELDPGKNYMFGYHPHGIIACGAFLNFATESTDFSEVFPGIKAHLLTVKGILRIPLLRSLMLWYGLRDSTAESIEWILTKQGTGNAALLPVGGMEEALEANPGSYNILLKKRKRFVKIAIQTGACLVPVFSFGENDLFVQAKNPEGSFLRSFQETCKKTIGYPPPLFMTFSVLPYRRPVHTVVGHPIEVEKVVDPDQSTIDHVHQQYMNALSELFDKHKVKYGVDSNATLNFI